MNRSTRMMLLKSGSDKESRRRRMGIEYEDWAPMENYGPYMPTTYEPMPMEPQSAFYDRRGRRHYNDGRYAPQNAYMPMEPWSASPDRRMEPSRRGDSPRMIGFGREWAGDGRRADATMPQLIEMDHLRGQRDQQGMATGYGLPRFDRQMAMEWVKGMENADGTKGPHWTMEQTNKAMQDYKVDCDPVEFWAVMNSLYSDYCEALKKNNANTMETYACLAKAWIHDEDAVPDKAAAYFTYIVEH